MAELFLLFFAGLLLVCGVVVWRASIGARFRSELVAYELQFPRDLQVEAVTSFLTGLSGLAGSRWQRWRAAHAVIFEVHAEQGGIRHRLLVPRSLSGTVLAAMRAHLPAARVTMLAEVPVAARASVAAQLRLSDYRRPLATGAPVAVATGILASLQPLRSGEAVLLQWVIEPAGPTAALDHSEAAGQVTSWLERWLAPAPVSRELVAAQRVKRAGALFLVTPRLAVTASSTSGARQVLGRVLAAFHAANAPGTHLVRRMLPSGLVARNLAGRFLPLVVPPCWLNATELSMLVGFPVGGAALPGLRLGASRLLAPAADIPSRGRVVAEASFPGAQRPLALSVTDSLRHLHVIGPTGVGKSTLLVGLIAQDMAAGRGVIVIDPKGDLAGDVLDRVPRSRVGDVSVLDPSDVGRPVGFNLLGGPPEASELLVDQVVGTLHSLFAASWGPRTDDILRSALLTLVGQPGMTLCEVPLLLSDQAFRRRLVGRIDEPVALGPFWAWYEALSDAERAQAVGPVLNKLRAFLLRRTLRNVLGQATPELDLGQVLAEGRILIVPLAKGVLGEEAAALIGSLLVARLWQAVMGRAAAPAESRRPVFCYFDEFQDFLRLPTSVADVLAQARGLGMGLTLAHQHLGQLPKSLKEDVLANARSRVIFQTAASDAQRLGREVAPHLSAADLQGLGPYEVVLTLSAQGRIASPVTGRTLLPPAGTGMAEAAREHSRRVYGQDRDDVEAAIRKRHTGTAAAAAVGRREVNR
jgi:hypothetical protein